VYTLTNSASGNAISAFAVTPHRLRLIGTASSGGTDPDSVTIAAARPGSPCASSAEDR
jgi:hypothetical protein